jgi:predicted nucleic acid-binding protein
VKVYVDSSALIKRAVAEAESETLERVLERHAEAADALVSSTLAWIEISRALRARLDGESHEVSTRLSMTRSPVLPSGPSRLMW